MTRERRRSSRRGTFLLSLHDVAGGWLHIDVRPLRETDSIRVKPCLIELTFWREGPDVIRGALRHKASGVTAYFQGTGALEELSSALDLKLVSAPAR
jgi:hypothetical protein